MRAVAQRRFTGCFAAAKINLAIFVGLIKHRLEAGIFVLAIAKGLVFRLAAAAPEIALTGFHFSFIWRFLRTFSLAHGFLLSCDKKHMTLPPRRATSQYYLL